jgi:hypothetical protein
LIYRIPASARGHEISAKDRLALTWRLKRHPSIAVQEVIRPDAVNHWHPLGEQFWGHMHLLSFTAELVCAEMFLFASPSNIFALNAELLKLRRKFGIPDINTDQNSQSGSVIEELTSEIMDFAKATGFSERHPSIRGPLDPDIDSLQRSILIIPAMSSRSADYHIFGQAQHLAAGLVTVFANHSGKSSAGGSAFIGLDAWKPVDQRATPYGEIGPGLFQYEKKDFGPLKEHECALVIADVDPMHTTDQKPRPQYMERPLQLVAHLPLIFETEACSDWRADEAKDSFNAKSDVPSVKVESPAPELQAKNDLTKQSTEGKEDVVSITHPSSRDHPDGKRIVRRRDLLSRAELSTFERAISEVWKNALIAVSKEQYADPYVNRCLQILESFADDAHWLAERRKQLTKVPNSHPQSGLPAAFVDWIYIDDGFDC